MISPKFMLSVSLMINHTVLLDHILYIDICTPTYKQPSPKMLQWKCGPSCAAMQIQIQLWSCSIRVVIIYIGFTAFSLINLIFKF
jgi:hypothetical protein